MSEKIIGRARFVDGTTRPVYLDGERQYVLDEGERVYGWFVIPEEDPCDAPVIVDQTPDCRSPQRGLTDANPRR